MLLQQVIEAPSAPTSLLKSLSTGPFDRSRIRRLPNDVMSIAATALSRLRHPGPRPGYIGWAGHGNLGDDVMFCAARTLLGPELEILASRPREWLFRTLLLGGSSRYPKLALGGGTLINSRYLPIVEDFLDRGSRMVTLGTGVGSVGFTDGESTVDPRWIQALEKFERVGVRGPLSLSRLREAGFVRGEIIGDLALAATPEKPIADWQARSLLFNFAQGASIADREMLATIWVSMAKLLKQFSRSGWQIIPVAFEQSDRVPIRNALEAINLSDRCIEAPQTFDEYARLAAASSLSIGVRLHSTVLASMCGIPNILVNYRDKCKDFAASVGMEQNLVPLDRFNEELLFRAVERIVSSPISLGRALHATCLAYKNGIGQYARSLF